MLKKFTNIILGLIIWQGLYLGAEQTQLYNHFNKPAITISTTALWTIKHINIRAVYIQPTTAPYDPVVQVGFSMRIW